MILSFLRLLLGLPKANKQPNISLVFVSLSSREPNQKIVGLNFGSCKTLEAFNVCFQAFLRPDFGSVRPKNFVQVLLLAEKGGSDSFLMSQSFDNPE